MRFGTRKCAYEQNMYFGTKKYDFGQDNVVWNQKIRFWERQHALGHDSLLRKLECASGQGNVFWVSPYKTIIQKVC